VRPTLEVNGMWGGFQGEGIKTVLPSTAHAKITCRLVPDQDPDKVLDLVEAHIMANVPPGVQVSVRRFPGSARPYVMPVKHIALTVAADILSSIYGRRPLVTRMGGTLPVAEMFRRLLGVNMVFYSFGGPDDQIHTPDESLPLAAIRRGIVAHYEYLGALDRVDAQQLPVSPCRSGMQGGMVRRLLGVNMVFYSFGGPDDQIHTPDESLPLAAIRRGIVAHYEYLGALARVDARQLQVSP